jgi:serine protease Do
VTGWHFVRTDAATAALLCRSPPGPRRAAIPCPPWPNELWGIGLRNKDEDFTPYFLTSQLALIQALPQQTGIAQQEVAGPGLPVFNEDGVFIGLAASSFGQTFLQLTGPTGMARPSC